MLFKRYPIFEKWIYCNLKFVISKTADNAVTSFDAFTLFVLLPSLSVNLKTDEGSDHMDSKLIVSAVRV